jgi:hypothetical protein
MFVDFEASALSGNVYTGIKCSTAYLPPELLSVDGNNVQVKCIEPEDIDSSSCYDILKNDRERRPLSLRHSRRKSKLRASRIINREEIRTDDIQLDINSERADRNIRPEEDVSKGKVNLTYSKSKKGSTRSNKTKDVLDDGEVSTRTLHRHVGFQDSVEFKLDLPELVLDDNVLDDISQVYSDDDFRLNEDDDDSDDDFLQKSFQSLMHLDTMYSLADDEDLVDLVPASPSMDVWSLALVIFELCSGMKFFIQVSVICC